MTYFSEDDQDGNAHPEPAAWFDYSAVERGLGTVEAMEAGYHAERVSAESVMLSKIIEICAEGLTKITRRERRASTAGIRLLCLGMAMRPGQIQISDAVGVAETLGVDPQHIRRIARRIRKKLASSAGS